MPGRVVVGVDGSDASRAALAFGLEEARVRGAALEVVHAWEPPLAAAGVSTAGLTPGFAPSAFEGADVAEVFDEVRRAAQELPARMVEEAGRPEGLVVTTSSIEGGAADALVRAGKGADLLVVGSHRRGTIAELVLGSVARDVLHRATCPVVLVPAGQSSPE